MRRTDPLLENWVPDSWDDVEVVTADDLVKAPRRGKGGRWLLLMTVVFVAGVVVAAGLGGRWALRQVAPPGEPGDPVNFTVAQGDSVAVVADRLQQAGIVTNARMFLWYVERKGGLSLEPGYYTLKPRDDLGNIVEALSTPPEQTYTQVTFPEGYTLARIGERLQKEVPRLSADRFAAAAASGSVRSLLAPETSNLEGLLFPDTYQVGGNETEAQMVARLVRQMERVAAKAGIAKSAEKVGLTPYQVLTVASMIEREAKVDDDRALIARVIYNRLFLGMPLQIDATLFYNTPEDMSFDERVELDSPYNTYKNSGLPPTPIANPGRRSIEAALNPAPNPPVEQCPGQEPCAWLYYVLADAEGRHVFATNLDDHERNVAAARELGLLG